MKSAYRFTKKKSKPYYYVTFAHVPNRWFSTHSKTLEGAIAFAKTFMERQKNIEREITLRDFADGFFTASDPRGYRHRLERRDTHYQPHFFRQMQGILDNYILKENGSFLLSAIDETLIEDHLLDIPNLANATKNKVLMCYRIVLSEAVRQGYININPAEKVKPLPPKSQPRGVFTTAELATMFPPADEEVIQFWGSLKWATYFAIMKDTGWRPSEVAGLSRANWYPDLQGVFTTVSVDGWSHQLKNRIKTSDRGQTFKEGFVSDQTARLIVALIRETPSEYLFLIDPKDEGRGFVYPRMETRWLRARCKKNGFNLGNRTQYSFRHTFNTNALGNIPESARLLLMGHTANRQEYNHLTPRQNLERVLSMDGVRETLPK